MTERLINRLLSTKWQMHVCMPSPLSVLSAFVFPVRFLLPLIFAAAIVRQSKISFGRKKKGDADITS